MKEKMKTCGKIARLIVPCLLAVFFVVIAALYFYYDDVVRITEEGEGTYFTAEADEERSYSLNGRTIAQCYTTTREEIQRIGIAFDTWGDVSGIDVYAQLVDTDTGKQLQQWMVSADLLAKGGTFDYFTLDEPQVGTGRNLEMRLTAKETGESSGDVRVHSSNSPKIYGKLTVNGFVYGNAKLALAVMGNVDYVGTLFRAVAAGFVLIVILFYILLKKKKSLRTENLFLIAGIFIGAVYMMLFTPYSEPDGEVHVITSFYYADLLNGRQATDEYGRVLARQEDVNREGISRNLGLDTLNTAAEHFQDMEEDTQQTAFFRGKLQVPFSAHLPQTLGTALGMALGLGTMPTLYLGKTFGYLFYLLCCYFAIRLIPFGKMVLFCTALLPFSLETATSYSYDSTVLSLGILMTGYALYLRYEKKRISIWNVLFWFLLTAWITPCKIVYGFLGLLVLLFPRKKFKRNIYYYLTCCLTAAVAGGSLLLSRLTTITKTVTGTMGDYFTIEMFFEDLPNSLMMIGRTIDQNADLYIKQLFGGVYSWFDVNLAWLFVIAYILLMCLAAVSLQQERYTVKNTDKAVMGIIFLLVAAAIAASMLFTWTSKTSDTIDGIQGRYFLPVLPLAVFLFKNRLVLLQKDISRQLALGVILVQFMTVMQLFTTIITK